MKICVLIFLMFGMVGGFETASAHARFLNNGKLKLRNTGDGNKTGPCGAGVRAAQPTELRGGESLEISWEETIQHKGYFQISFAKENDSGFENHVLATIPDNQDNSTLPHSYSTTITVPNIACEQCTLQLIQWMGDTPGNFSPYYSCADIKIINNPQLPTPSPTPASTPEPSSADAECK